MEFDNQDNCDLDTKSASTQNSHSLFNDAESKKSVSELVSFFERCSSKSTLIVVINLSDSEEQRERAHAVEKILTNDEVSTPKEA